MLLTLRKPNILALLLVCFALVCTGLSSVFASPVSAADDKPPPPTNLIVISTTHNSITIDWDNIEGVDPYATGYWVSPGGWNSGDGQMTIGGLTPNTEYTISVGANVAGANVSTVTARTTEAPPDDTKPEPPLTAPQALKITDISETAIKLAWTGSPGALAYDIYEKGNWIKTLDANATEYIYSITEPITAGEEIIFTVAAQALPKISKPSNAVKITWGELAAPVDLQIVTATRSTSSIAWAAVPGATEYYVYQDGTQVGTVSENRYLAANLNEGQTYSFFVEAKNPLWKSPASANITVVPGSQYNHVTYFTSWGVYARDFQPEDVEMTKVTHINYAFADLCWDGFSTGGKACKNESLPLQKDYVHDGVIIIGDPDADPANFAAFADMKVNHPHLNMMVSVGGWSWSKNFSNMAATEETRRAFAASAVDYLREYKLDGLDIDWEYPVEGGETYNDHLPEDKQNFTLLMKTVREALDAAGSVDGKYYLLTIASGQGDNFVINADLANSVQYLDFINIMTYDYSGKWDLLAHHNSPLYYDPNHPSSSAPRNHVSGGALGHLNGGVPPHKLLIGVPFYGKFWVGCPEVGQYETCEGIAMGSYEEGIYDYDDIENNFMNNDSYDHYWNEYAKVPYLFNEETGAFITYNDKTTMMYTASLVKSLDIAGVMSWDISGDENDTLSSQIATDLPIHGIVNENALEAPQNLQAHYVDYGSIGLTWDAVAGATSYEVFIDNTYAGAVDEPAAEVYELMPATEFTFTVLAVREADNQIAEVSPFSVALTAKTLGLDPPSNVTVSDKGEDFITIKWDAAPVSDEYAVFLFDEIIDFTTETEYTFEGLLPGTGYNLSVAAITLEDEEIKDVSASAGVIDVITLGIAAPANLSIDITTQTSIKVKWDASITADGYELYLNNQSPIYTTETSYTFSNLSSNTTYTIKVVAVQKEGEDIIASSEASTIEAKTSTVSSPPSSSGSYFPAPPVKDKDELDASISKSGDKWTISITKDAAIKTIEAAGAVKSFNVTIEDGAKLIDIVLPKEVIAALTKKGEEAQLSIIWNDVTYVIPVDALPADTDIQISIAPPAINDVVSMEKVAEESNLELLIDALDFKISKRTADNKFEEVTNFGGQMFSRIFTLEGDDIDPSKLTGVVFIPGTNEFRPVPSLFTENEDGTITVELKRDGNSIYTIVQFDIAYSDATAEWMVDAVSRAAAKLLLAGETEETFGVDTSITRAEFTSMIVKGLGILPVSGEAPFEDVAADSEYAGDIAAAKAVGLVKGKSATMFDPDATISRQDITMILSNVLDYLGVDTEADVADLGKFADAGLISGYAKSAVALIVEEGIMIGKSASKFDPTSDLTRAEAAIIVIRILESLELDKA